MKILGLLLISLIIYSVYSEKQRFDNYSVIRIRFETESELQNFFSILPKDSLDVFSHDGASGIKLDMDILLTPEQMKTLELSLFTKSLYPSKFEVLNENFQESIDEEAATIKRIDAEIEEQLKNIPSQKERERFLFSQDVYYRNYHNHSAISNYLENLRETHRTMSEKIVIGETIEKRQILVYTIHAPGAFNANKPSLWINNLQHAREWISPPVGNYMYLQFLSKYNSDAQIKRLLDKINVFYLPMVNVDGFLFSHSNNRMWRKNRRLVSGSTYGVDLNRNWKSGFGGSGSSNVPSSETYRGTAFHSEPETKAIDTFIRKYPSIKAGIDFHSYSQLNLRPWSKSFQPSPDENILRPLGQKMVDAIKATHGATYQNILGSGLYIASGCLNDELYETHKQMGFTIELRPTQSGGTFAPPPSQILPTVEENWKAILVLAEHVHG